MLDFDLTISHVFGKENVIADALSQYYDLDPINCATVIMNTESNLLDMIKRAQEQEQTVRFSNLKERALASERGIYIHERLVYRQSCTGSQTIVIPEDSVLQQRIFPLHQYSRFGGHLGAYLIGSISTLHYWPKMASDVCAYMKQCQTYQVYKIITHNS